MPIMGTSTGTRVRGIVQQRRKSLFGQQSFEVCKFSEGEKEGEKWARKEIFSDLTILRRKQYQDWKRKGIVKPNKRHARKWLYHVTDKAPIYNLFDGIASE